MHPESVKCEKSSNTHKHTPELVLMVVNSTDDKAGGFLLREELQSLQVNTLVNTPPLWRYCVPHQHEEEEGERAEVRWWLRELE